MLHVEWADIVLGNAWLISVDPITSDYSILQLSFQVNGKQVVLQGEPLSIYVLVGFITFYTHYFV